jgi:hypothetical protein
MGKDRHLRFRPQAPRRIRLEERNEIARKAAGGGGAEAGAFAGLAMGLTALIMAIVLPLAGSLVL